MAKLNYKLIRIILQKLTKPFDKLDDDDVISQILVRLSEPFQLAFIPIFSK